MTVSHEQYSPIVADYFERLPLAGTLDDDGDADPASSFIGAAGNREQGTQVIFHTRIRDAQIEEIRYQVFGCPHTIAACGLAAEGLTGRPATGLTELTTAMLAEPLALPVEKTGRMLVIQDALRNCFLAWDNRRLD
jgi:NifU-like protein involved in Fe-S cluster formation